MKFRDTIIPASLKMSRAIGWFGDAAAVQDIYQESTVQYHELGEPLCLKDGREFVYACCSDTLIAGTMASKIVSVGNHHSRTIATTDIGSKTLTVTLAAGAVAENAYADGYLGVIAGTGDGQCYKILSHPSSAGGTTLVFTLYDPLVIATSSSDSKADLAINPYSSVVHSTNEELLDAGIPLIAVTSGSYAWLQTRGIGVCLSGDTAGENTILSRDDAAGDLKAAGDYLKGLSGISVGQARADGEYNFLQLRLS